MKVYIGLGGIGTRTLRDYSDKCSDKDASFYYIDTEDPAEAPSEVFTVRSLRNGSGALRGIGRNAVKYELFAGKLAQYLSDIKTKTDIELIFVLSSFGGFGSAAVFPIIEYIEAIAWDQIRSCVVLAFNDGAYKKWGFPEECFRIFESNSIAFVRDSLMMDQTLADYKQVQELNGSLFVPFCSLYLIDTTGMEPNRLSECIGYTRSALDSLNCKQNYHVENSVKERKQVFISYNKADQKVADRIADRLEDKGISSWIATREITAGSYARQIIQGINEARVFVVLISKDSIVSQHVKNEIDRAFSRLNDGLVIIPFILDSSELDDECKYYLCRQEKLSAVQPPLEARISELIDRVKELV